MDQNFKQAFDSVQASERLKRKTKAALRRKTFDYGRDVQRQRSHRIRIAACFAALVLTLSGAGSCLLPASYIDLDVNPSVEMKINVWGRVLSLRGLNRDGTDLAAQVDVDGMPYADAMQRILISDYLDPYLEDGCPISITVVGGPAVQTKEMLENVVCRAYAVAEEENVFYFQADAETAKAAKAAGLSVIRYQALQQMQQQDPAFTAEDVQQMSMQEMLQLLDFQALEDPCGEKERED